MPLDGALPDPDLRSFIAILRDKSTWPRNFKWDYTECETCAMGLAEQLYQISETKIFEDIIGMTENDATEILCGLAMTPKFKYLKSMSQITPEDVADALEAWLEKEPTGKRNAEKMKELELCH